MAKICIVFALAFIAVVAAAPQSIQQHQVVPGPAQLNGQQRAAAPASANPEQGKDLESAGSIGYGYYGGYPSYGYSSLYYGGYPSFGGIGGYGYGSYPYYTRGFGGLYGGYWY